VVRRAEAPRATWAVALEPAALLRLVHRLGDLVLDAHELWLDEVEQELSQP